MSLNVKKSACIRIGPRFNNNCCNIVTREGRELAWINVVRTLESSSSFKCSLGSTKCSFYRSFNAVLGKIGRIASREVILQLIKSKYFRVLYYGLEVVLLIMNCVRYLLITRRKNWQYC